MFPNFPYSASFRQNLLLLSGDEPVAMDDLCRENFMLGEAFANAVIRLARKAKMPLVKIDLIGSHGQTVRHLPPKGKKTGATLQIGEAAVIAERTGITTIADFRPADIAAGGHGAPLAPFLHYRLFRKLPYGVGVQNVGGIGNLTFIPQGANLLDVIAFDTGPGNVLMDTLAYFFSGGRKRFDRGGEMAAKGKVNVRLLDELLSHPYFSKSPPKSTGRELFGCAYARSLYRKTRHMKREDTMATVTAFTAYTIAKSYERFIKPRFRMRELIVGGGGARNRTLLYQIQKLMPDVQIKRFEDYQLNGDAIEAMAFALLAYEAAFGKPGNIPNVTGAAHVKLLGKIIPGNNFKRLDLN